MNMITNEACETTASHKSLSSLKNKIIRHIKYTRDKARMDGILPPQVKTVGDIVTIKQNHTFLPPKRFSRHIRSEQELRNYGKNLYDTKELNVFPTNEVDLILKNAYRMMTILNPLPESDDINISQKEVELLKYIRVCIRAKGDQEEVEGSTFDTTIVFSSLGLL